MGNRSNERVMNKIELKRYKTKVRRYKDKGEKAQPETMTQ